MKARMIPMAALLAASFALFHVGNDLGHWASLMRPMPDDLAWLRQEFGADEGQMKLIAGLQATYRRQSDALVQSVEWASRRVATALDEAGELTPSIRADLAELEAARARSHASALQHCIEVARILGPEHGPRYLREMERVLIGLHVRHHNHPPGRSQSHARVGR
jgi:hypothetical protein